jgi:hypothetical protein
LELLLLPLPPSADLMTLNTTLTISIRNMSCGVGLCRGWVGADTGLRHAGVCDGSRRCRLRGVAASGCGRRREHVCMSTAACSARHAHAHANGPRMHVCTRAHADRTAQQQDTHALSRASAPAGSRRKRGWACRSQSRSQSRQSQTD